MAFAVSGRAKALYDRVFVDREFMHYCEERGMRVLQVSARKQALGAGAAAVMLSYLGATTAYAVAGPADELQAELQESRAELRDMRRQVAAIENGVALKAAQIERRQAFLDGLMTGEADLDTLAEIMPKDREGEETASSELLSPLAEIEGEQLAFVEQAAVAAAARYQDRRATLETLGLRPERFLRQTDLGMGGPEVPADAKGGPLAGADPRFKELFLSWKKLDLLEKEMAAVPSTRPVKSFTYTSGYGVRFDPFRGTTAMHQGVDMAGAVGEPVLAAGEGRVVRAGWHGGYGKLVEIAHGKGLTTRYAHLSRLDVKKGDRVKPGEQIGGMGSTGRSTGSHLHYEVRLDGRAVNPMPFLEAGVELAANMTAGAMGGE